MYEHILVALDGSAIAEHTLPHAEALAEKFEATLTLLRATNPLDAMIPLMAPAAADPSMVPAEDLTPLLIEDRAEAQQYLEQLATRLRGLGYPAEVEQPEGEPAHTIVE